MTVTVGINGFGRIGRCTFAHIANRGTNDIQVIKLNATRPVETNAHLLRYDSVHGRFSKKVAVVTILSILDVVRLKSFQRTILGNSNGEDAM